jgi:hypothetical protein
MELTESTGEDTPKPKAEPTELLPQDDPILLAWVAISMILDEIDAPKTRKFRKLRATSTQQKKAKQPTGDLRG